MSDLKHIAGHLEERRAEAREHFAQHLEDVARRVRAGEAEPIGVAALVLFDDGSRDAELCCGGGLDSLALAASMDSLARALAEEG